LSEYKTGILKLPFLGIEAFNPTVDINVTYAKEQVNEKLLLVFPFF